MLSFVYYVNGGSVIELNHCGIKEQDMGPLKVLKATSNILLTVIKSYFCCGSFVLHGDVSACLRSLAFITYIAIHSASVLFCYVIEDKIGKYIC